jgi:hypothetical protein
MTALATLARIEVAQLLTNKLGSAWKVYLVAAPTPVVPSVTIVGDTPYMRPERIGSSLNYALRLKLLVAVDMRVTLSAIAKLEQACEDCMTAVEALVEIVEVSPPQVTDLGPQGSILVSEISVIAHLKE